MDGYRVGARHLPNLNYTLSHLCSRIKATRAMHGTTPCTLPCTIHGMQQCSISSPFYQVLFEVKGSRCSNQECTKQYSLALPSPMPFVPYETLTLCFRFGIVSNREHS